MKCVYLSGVLVALLASASPVLAQVEKAIEMVSIPGRC